jgi:protein disulfide-isomerase A1
MQRFSFITLCVLLFICTFTYVQAHGHGHHHHDGHDHEHTHDEGSTKVVNLNKDNFDAEVSGASLSLVEFFAPWCGHCKQLAPQYKAASLELDGVAKLFAVDCTVEKEVCDRFGVRGFPTLKVFRGDLSKATSYEGGRSAKDIVQYMTKLNQPAYVHLVDAEAVNNFLTTKPEARIIGVFEANSNNQETFIELATENVNDYAFAYVTDVALLSALPEVVASKVTIASPSIVIFKTEDVPDIPSVETTAFVEKQELAEFIKEASFPVLGTVGPENFKRYVDRNLPLAWSFYDPDDSTYPEQLQAIAQAAYGFRHQISAVKLDGKKWADHSRHFGIPAGQLPAIAIEDRAEIKKYVYSGAFTQAELASFFEQFINHQLQPTLKSQEIPEDNSGPVKVVVGKNFDEIVMDNQKDVFLEIYAPWCGHCKQLAPNYEELGRTFQGTDNVVIAKCDGTENDTPVQIQGYPHLVFYAAGQKDNPVVYEGDRTPQAMASWIRAHGTTFKSDSNDSDAAASSSHEEL